MGMRNGSKTRRLTAAERRELALLESYYRTVPGAVEEWEGKYHLIMRRFVECQWEIGIIDRTTGEVTTHIEHKYRSIRGVIRELAFQRDAS